MMINTVVDLGLLSMLLATTLLMVRSQSPLSLIVLSSIYSLIICTLFVILDAVDVAFTEAAVGAGISAVLFVAVIRPQDEPRNQASGSASETAKFSTRFKAAMPSLSAISIGLVLAILLIVGSTDMPLYGDPNAAIHHHLAPRFLGQSMDEIGIANAVTSVLASYRGYDTLGEVVVIFTAGIAVFLLLGVRAGNVGTNNHSPTPAHVTDTKPDTRSSPLIANPILKTVLLRFIPIVLLFALYVQFHGDYGPGGGFQAGVIFAAALITYALLTDVEKLQRIISHRIILCGMAFGVLLYGSVGLAGLFFGGNFLDYSVLQSALGSQIAGQHLGIFLIELGIGITVAATIVSLFISFNQQPADLPNERI